MTNSSRHLLHLKIFVFWKKTVERWWLKLKFRWINRLDRKKWINRIHSKDLTIRSSKKMLNSEPPCHSDHLIPGRSFAPNQSQKKKENVPELAARYLRVFPGKLWKKKNNAPSTSRNPGWNPFPWSIFSSAKKNLSKFFFRLLSTAQSFFVEFHFVAHLVAVTIGRSATATRWGCFFLCSPRRALATSKLLRACAKQLSEV